jgi:HlyD family secretion protein
VEVGESVGAQPVVGLVDDSHYYVDVTVDEIDVATVKVGQTARITLDALPGASMSGTIQRINPASSLLNGVVSYTARVQIDEKDPRVRPGMSADVSIVVGLRNDALLAPNWAVRVDPQTGKAWLTVKDGNATRQIEVSTGLRDETHTEILSGAETGQMVVAPAP